MSDKNGSIGTWHQQQLDKLAKEEAEYEKDWQERKQAIEDEFNGLITGLILFFVIAMSVVIAVVSFNNKSQRDELARSGCILTERIYDTKDYCGKACFQEMYYHRFECKVAPTTRITRQSPMADFRATERDDYFKRK